jgi:hypothetical protein
MTHSSRSKSDRAADQDAASETSTSLTDAVSEAVERAGDFVEQGAEAGIQQADRGLELAAEGAESVATTIRRVSGEIRTDQPQIADVAEAAADRADDVARFLHETNVRKLIGSLEEGTRRQPLLYVGGAFVLGVAVSRLFRGR